MAMVIARFRIHVFVLRDGWVRHAVLRCHVLMPCVLDTEDVQEVLATANQAGPATIARQHPRNVIRCVSMEVVIV